MKWLIRLLMAVVLGYMLAGGGPLSIQDTHAKGVTRTEQDAESTDREETKEETRQSSPREQPSAPARAPSTEPSEPRRNDSDREAPARATPERSDKGTPNFEGQAEKRDERRDPDYEYRKHYRDNFFHPYDYRSYRYYPWYDRDGVILIPNDLGYEHRPRWRREYEYRNPAPGSLEEALVDIQATWMEEQPEFLMWHVDPKRGVDVYNDGRYSHELSPRQIYKLTTEAVDRLETVRFDFTSVDRRSFSAEARARHEYRSTDGKTRSARLTYYLEKVRERWIITRIYITDGEYGSSSCFIATAAFGTPMSKEVKVLRRFRDKHLLTNSPGTVFVSVYYKLSPPVADRIRGSETSRAVVRAALRPVIRLCKVFVEAG